MKVWTLGADEWFPVWTLNRHREDDSGSEEKEFSDEEIAELRALEKKFVEWQIKIAERFNEKVHRDYGLVYEEGVENQIDSLEINHERGSEAPI